MSELGALRPAVHKRLKAVGMDPVPIENRGACPGTPDTNYIEGWIELKKIKAWPKRAATAVKIDHYTPQQRLWALRRRKSGGRVHLLLQVGREWLLLDGAVAAKWLCYATQAQLRHLATRVWPQAPRAEELLECLRLPQLEVTRLSSPEARS